MYHFTLGCFYNFLSTTTNRYLQSTDDHHSGRNFFSDKVIFLKTNSMRLTCGLDVLSMDTTSDLDVASTDTTSKPDVSPTDTSYRTHIVPQESGHIFQDIHFVHGHNVQATSCSPWNSFKKITSSEFVFVGDTRRC